MAVATSVLATPSDEKVILGELVRLHQAHERIEGRLEALFECQKGIDVSMAELCRHCLAREPAGEEVAALAVSKDLDSVATEDRAPSKLSSSEHIGRRFVFMSDCDERGEHEIGHESSEGSKAFVASTLPLGWPQVLEVRSELDALSPTRLSRFRVSDASSMNGSQSCRFSHEFTEDSEMVSHCCVIDPNSRFHMMWIMSSIVVLVWDLIVLPYVLVWEVELSGVLHLTWFLTPAFWTVDLVLNFFTASYSGVDLQKSLPKIRRAYVRSWFAPDIMVVSFDWISVIISEMSRGRDGGSDGLKTLRFIKLGRLLRILDMMRVVRMFKMMEEIAMLYLTEGTRIGLQMLNLLMGIMVVVHFLACAWFGIGKGGPSDTGARWTETFDILVDGQIVPVIEAGHFYQYMICFHWAAGQIALGGIDVMPVNSFERGFFACVMLCGFLFGSTLVSTLSAAMIDYRMMRKDKVTRIRMLRRYLRENGVGAHLYLPVVKQVEQRVAQCEPVDEKDVTALHLLSSSLRSQLRYEIQMPFLSRHAVFRVWGSLDSMFMHRICMRAVKLVNIRAKDELFAPGNVANGAYALVCGRMVYRQDPDSSPVQSESLEEVGAGQWISEAALWVQWTHVGRCEAKTACKLLDIDAAELLNGLQSNMIIRDIGLEYCCQFHKRVTSACPPHSAYPTDMRVPLTDYCDIVVSMSPHVQVIIGRDALGHLSASGHGRSAKVTLDLQREVDSLKSIVLVEGTGAIIRVVSLTVLQLTKQSGEVFAHIGKWTGSDVKGICQLPGAKHERGELVEETVSRFIQTRIPDLDGKLDYTGITRETHEKTSKEYGVQTRYLRTICSARLLPGKHIDAPKCVLQNGRIGERWSRSEFPQQDPEQLDATQMRLLNELCAVDVYILRGNSGNPSLYAWLSPEQVSILGTSSGDFVLQNWISKLAFENAPPEVDAEEFAL